MKISITEFAGISPKVPARQLPPAGAQIAINGPMFNGTLQGLADVGPAVFTLTKSSAPETIYRFGMDISNPAEYWFSWGTDVNITRGPLYGDPSETTFFTTTDASFPPQFTYNTLALTGTGTNYPLASYELGIPAPTVAPQVSAVGASSSGTIPETRVYVYTFVAELSTGWVEESAPSPPSEFIEIYTNLTGIELLLNPGFATDLSDWTTVLGTGSTASWSTYDGGGSCNLTAGGAAVSAGIYQSFGSLSGTPYTLTVDCNVLSGQLWVSVGTSATDDSLLSTAISSGTSNLSFTANGADVFIRLFTIAQLLTNPNFTSGLTGWTTALPTGCTATTSSSGCILSSGTSGGLPTIYQEITTVVGSTYYVKFNATLSTGATLWVTAGSSSGDFSLGETIVGTGENQLSFTANATTSYIGLSVAIQLLLNPNFATDLTDWTPVPLMDSTATVTWASNGNGGSCKLTTPPSITGNAAGIFQIFTTVIGKTYTIAVNLNAVYPGVDLNIGVAPGFGDILNRTLATGSYSFQFTADGTTTCVTINQRLISGTSTVYSCELFESISQNATISSCLATLVDGDPSQSASVYSCNAEVSIGQTANISGFPMIVTGYSGAPITGIRIYRATEGVYQLVAQIPMPSGVYNDSQSANQLAEALPSLTWLPPPATLIGLVSMPNGMLCGFDSASPRDVYICDPYHPHAWPIANVQTVDYPVVGLGVMDTTLAVLTKGRPFFIQGTDPSSMVQVEADIRQACISKRSIVSANGVVYYASPDGLVMLSSNGSQILTLGQFTRAQWQAINPSTITATFFDNKYIAFFSGGGGFIYDMLTNQFMNHTLSCTASYVDMENEILYLGLSSGNIVEWAAGSDTLSMDWKSKKFSMTQITGFSCAKLQAENYPMTVLIYADENLIQTKTVTSKAPFRLPAVQAKDWEVEIQGSYEVYAFVIAQSMQEIASD